MKIIENFNISTKFKDLNPGDVFRTIYTEQYYMKCKTLDGIIWNAVKLDDGGWTQIGSDLEVYKCGDITIGKLGVK